MAAAALPSHAEGWSFGGAEDGVFQPGPVRPALWMLEATAEQIASHAEYRGLVLIRRTDYGAGGAESLRLQPRSPDSYLPGTVIRAAEVSLFGEDGRARRLALDLTPPDERYSYAAALADRIREELGSICGSPKAQYTGRARETDKSTVREARNYAARGTQYCGQVTIIRERTPATGADRAKIDVVIDVLSPDNASQPDAEQEETLNDKESE